MYHFFGVAVAPRSSKGFSPSPFLFFPCLLLLARLASLPPLYPVWIYFGRVLLAVRRRLRGKVEHVRARTGREEIKEWLFVSGKK